MSWKFIFVIPTLFFIVSFLTLSDYGINWDEPIHFNRGQGYLYYFLTGKIEQDKPITDRPSFFNGYDVKALYDWDGGHPVTSDILAAISNFIFYQKLGLVGDIQGYHLFNLFTATLAVFIVAIFAYQTYGLFASIVASLAIATYPLFFSEAHFNIKDPPETAFFALTIFAFWKSLEKGNWKWLLLSSISAGLALGTKLNIVFLPLIILPYLLFRYFYLIKNGHKFFMVFQRIPFPYRKMLILFPLIMIAIPFVTWPFLWENTLAHISKVLYYYKNIAIGFDYQPAEYRFLGFNLYPIFWIIATSPLWVLVLSLIGIIYALLKPDKKKTTWLWLLWLVIPIVRVSLPSTVIYGGVRQIMEFLPAMALLAGLGGHQLVLNLKQAKSLKFKNWSLEFVCILVFGVWSLIPIIRLHPNQNVYFNFLVGGLAGAKERDIPSWGNSYGNAYWQAIQWINENAEEGAQLALVQGTGQNVPLIQLRSDINFSGTNWSGINRNGEYLMELVYQGSQRAYPYVWDYLEKFLDSVYEVKVDGVSIAKVWKNDLQHTKPQMRRNEIKYPLPRNIAWEGNSFTVDTGKLVELTRIVIQFKDTPGCSKLGIVELSHDGNSWGKEQEKLDVEQVLRSLDVEGGVNFYLAAREARFIRVNFDSENHCFSTQSKISIYVLE